MPHVEFDQTRAEEELLAPPPPPYIFISVFYSSKNIVSGFQLFHINAFQVYFLPHIKCSSKCIFPSHLTKCRTYTTD